LIEKSLTASIRVKVALDDSLWFPDINQGELEDAIINLAVNARDAMPNGGELTIETSNRILDDVYAKSHAGAETGSYVLISVHDTGSGIGKDVIEKVLDPFFTTKPGSKGSGLGLSMVYGFVKRVRGYINISSELDKGTTVEIFLPRSDKNSCSEQPGINPEIVQQGGYETILVVDDEPELALIAENTLSKYGYSVLNASTASEAIKILDSHPEVDLLFSDVVMPGGMDGFALARYAKQKYPKIKTLLASGFTHKTNEQQYGEAGQSLLRKPYRKTELIIHVRKTLDSDKEQI
ncbi:MAG: ATP-binding protein, partial [Gammaproteobacteria bacterium]